MKNHTDKDNERTSGSKHQHDDAVARLMNLAGTRPVISTDIESRVHDKVRREWRDATAKSRITKWALPVALAAGLVIAFMLFMIINRTPPLPLGTIARLTGEIDSQQNQVAVNDVVYAGDTMRTKKGQGIGISLDNGRSLRLAEGTVLRLDSANTFILEHGKVYADSGKQVRKYSSVTIQTELGSVVDVGTQFAVQFADDQFRVAVREGRVDVAGDQGSYTALAGDRLIIHASGDVATDQISANDSSWNWATELAPDFEMEDKSLLAFLLWAVRETGRELVFASDEIREAASATILHGSISGFTPDKAIGAVLATTSFEFDINSGRLLIGK